MSDQPVNPFRTAPMMPVSEHEIRIEKLVKLLKGVNDKYENLETTSRNAA